MFFVWRKTGFEFLVNLDNSNNFFAVLGVEFKNVIEYYSSSPYMELFAVNQFYIFRPFRSYLVVFNRLQAINRLVPGIFVVSRRIWHYNGGYFNNPYYLALAIFLAQKKA